MAKVKISDFLKKIGIKLEDEIDIAEEQTVDVNKDKNLNNVEVDKDKETDDIEEEVETVKLPKYSKETGLFDLRGVDNEELRAILTESNTKVTNDINNALIDKELSTKVGALKLVAGVDTDVINAMLNKGNIKVVDGVVHGVDEAITELKTNKPGLFVKENSRVVKSTILNEGHNPMYGTQQIEKGKIPFRDIVASKNEYVQ